MFRKVSLADSSLVLPHAPTSRLGRSFGAGRIVRGGSPDPRRRQRELAVTGARRSLAAPGLPTATESGVPGSVVSGWYGFLAPAKTGAAEINWLNAELRRALAYPDVQKRFWSPARIAWRAPAEFGT